MGTTVGGLRLSPAEHLLVRVALLGRVCAAGGASRSNPIFPTSIIKGLYSDERGPLLLVVVKWLHSGTDSKGK